MVRRLCRGRYGDLAAGKAERFATVIRLDRGHNLNVTARILLNGDFTFCPIHDFNDLRMTRQRHSTTSARSASRQASHASIERTDYRDFYSPGLLSRNCFDFLVKMIVALSHENASAYLNLSLMMKSY